MKKRLVFLTGAGMSAESGLPTYRDAGGLWENHRWEDLASPRAWLRDPHTVRRFYNERLRQVRQARPNRGHELIAELQATYQVTVITQNVDDLHERAGSEDVWHLHGQIRQARSCSDPREIYELGEREFTEDLVCRQGQPLRPNIVWFGEPVPLFLPACELVRSAEYLIVIGTSLAVYPAASLIEYAPPRCPVGLIDPHTPSSSVIEGCAQYWPTTAAAGLPMVIEWLATFASK